MANKDQGEKPEAPQTGTRSPLGKTCEATRGQTGLAGPRNATGPRTESGKKRVCRNATKFGIFSNATLLEGESRIEYESFRRGLWKAKQPGDEFEEILLDKMASNLWRQRRVLIAEGAEIRRNSEFVEFDRRQKELEEAEEMRQRVYEKISPRFVSEPVGLIWSIENPEVLGRCIEILVELQHGIKTDGFDKEQDEFLLKSVYGDSTVAHLRPTLQLDYLTCFHTAAVTEEKRAQEGFATPEQCRMKVLRAIGAEIRRLEQYQEKRAPIESERKKVEILRQQVPDSPGVDRLIRYGSSLERAFERTLAQYERAQRVRKGQPLPPQVDVRIS